MDVAKGHFAPTSNDTLEFIQKIRVRFGDRSERYVSFLAVMEEFGNSDKCDQRESNNLVGKLEKILEGEDDLLNQLRSSGFIPTTEPIPHENIGDKKTLFFYSHNMQCFIKATLSTRF